MAPQMREQSQRFTVHLPQGLLKHYECKSKELGQGGFARVILAEHLLTKEKVAIKVMNKQLLDEKDDLHRAYNEIYALKSLIHPHICQLYEVYETREFIYLVLEYCPGGELFDYIVARKRLQEKEAQHFFQHIVSAVSFIHKQGYAHRDLKPENMLLDKERNIKLIDFGLAAKPEKGLTTPLTTRAGSALYASPELISGKPYFGNETDVWSLGVVLYALLCGFLPFDHESNGELYKKIKKGEFAAPFWLSSQALKLLRSMLDVNPPRRISIKNILCHEWVTPLKIPACSPKIAAKNQLKTSVVNVISRYYQWTVAETEQKILKFKYNHLTAFYFILFKMSDGGVQNFVNNTLSSKNIVNENLVNSLLTKVENTKLNGYICEVSSPNRMRSNTVDFQSSGVPRQNRRTSTFDGSTEKTELMDSDDDDLDEDIFFKKDLIRSPFSSHKPRPKSTLVTSNQPFNVYPAVQRLQGSTDELCSKNDNLESQQRLAASCVEHLDNLQPNERNKVTATEEKDGKRSRSRSMKDFTSRLSGFFKQEVKPRRVKAIYHVENTSTHSAEEVRVELVRVLDMLCMGDVLSSYTNPERYLFKCRAAIEKKTVFELEVCRIPYMDNVVGVRRKRLKGDGWQYKEIVEHILSMTKI